MRLISKHKIYACVTRCVRPYKSHRIKQPEADELARHPVIAIDRGPNRILNALVPGMPSAGVFKCRVTRLVFRVNQQPRGWFRAEILY